MRKIVIANVTDFAGCVGAEHYYCKYQVVDNVEFISEHLYDFNRLGIYSYDELSYIPSLEYAIEMVKKDNNGELGELGAFQVEKLMEFGTTRFRYLHDIKKTLEELFPLYDIIISKDYEVGEFWNCYLHENYRIAFDELPSKDKEEIFNEIMEDPFFYERYTDCAKYDAMFVHCFRKSEYPHLARLIKEHNEKD